ncbi:MAG: hypothetical protein ACLR8Y_05445 [Alistipes indistinctus]
MNGVVLVPISPLITWVCFSRVRDDLLTVANTVLDQFELVLGYLLIFFVLASSSFVARISLFGPADFVTQRIEALVLRREVQCAKERCEN